jgi:hypothetical protein
MIDYHPLRLYVNEFFIWLVALAIPTLAVQEIFSGDILKIF